MTRKQKTKEGELKVVEACINCMHIRMDISGTYWCIAFDKRKKTFPGLHCLHWDEEIEEERIEEID